MEPDRWQRIERIYHEAMQCDPVERDSLLETACSGDTGLRVEVESLLHYGDRPADFLERPAMEVMAQVLSEDLRTSELKSSMIGARIAQYRIIDKLGAGGMGDVYRAVRADDQFEMQVAIKLVRQGLETDASEARFRRERQILASFEHPNIARLFDGGTTHQGHPYFVMELVEGKPIDVYCDEMKLEITARLDIFRSVCSAVQYAHQRLVVHRDIKPSNILVTADGVPKLLDFGIATILSPLNDTLESEHTGIGLRIMTPQFASPEQLHGHLITTATDVYSLAVVLYKLLTGRMPYRIDRDSPYRLAQAICESTPEKPSIAVGRPISTVPGIVSGLETSSKSAESGGAEYRTDVSTIQFVSEQRRTSPDQLRRVLSGDLDQIVLKALRKEPERRYASAGEFADDIRSYLRGLPVAARRGTAAYRAGKFIKRNKLALAITSIFALLGLVGIFIIVREAHIARVQEARAEARFNDLRALANSMLFEIHDSIVALPGSTAARKLLVDRGLHYLDSLSRESAGIPGLQRELAKAYERVGDVQGNPYYANLGDTAGAIASYRKALNIWLTLVDSRRGSYEDQRALVDLYMKLGLGLEAASDFNASLDTFRKGYPIAESLAAALPNDPRAQESLAGMCFMLANALADTGDVASSVSYYRRSAEIREKITSGPPEFQEQVKTKLAGAYGYLAGDMRLQGDLNSAISLQRKAHDLLGKLVVADPQNARLQQFFLESEYWTAYYMAESGQAWQALPHYRTALAGFLKLTDADAHDVLALRYLGKCYAGIGAALAATGKPADGIRTVQKSLKIFDTLAAADHGDNFFKPVDLAYAQSAVADAYERLAISSGISEATKSTNWRAARFWYQQSLDTWRQLRHRAPLGQFDAAQPDKIAHEITVCDDALAGSTIAHR